MVENYSETTGAKPDLLSMTEEEIASFVSEHLCEPAYRGAQIYSWINKGVPFSEMTNLSRSLRDKLSAETEYHLPQIVKKLSSAVDGTKKYLLSLADGECVESVFMKYEHGNTVCVSCQAGCRMGCRFCASTLNGKRRNLTPGEILGQIIAIEKDTGERVGGVVMMGIGEPLDNYEASVKFLRLVSAEKGLGIGLRHISVSTCGIVPGIERLADEGLPVTLSVSLHASDDSTRSSVMPINNKYHIRELLEACNHYFEKTGRRVSFEYTLISGKNDSLDDADRLAELLKREMKSTCHVNLIRLNEVKETPFYGSAVPRAKAFCERLNDRGVTATVRRRLGSDIDASCGQLRLSAKDKDI
ncbi:MAG: 23S rRNA (adenine(2503)-C(2))-methyltransferase RlmN [Clostridia bacterium]|nr:23S rRNA (adenine(2503)-C(2))-methyltransferase RlmN [Clostridia bacterium]